jgi:hypothetical protein
MVAAQFIDMLALYRQYSSPKNHYEFAMRDVVPSLAAGDVPSSEADFADS